MLSKTINSKSILMNKVLWLLLLSTGIVQSQNVLVPDSTGVVQDNDKIEIKEQQATDTIKKFERFKAEGVSAVVGEYVLLDSDIDRKSTRLNSSHVRISYAV